MRLEVLKLLSFGPFEGTSLQFSHHGSLEVVFGPNEAGKSTTRRAVLGLLFGIPDRSTDGHSVRGDVRVGGVLRDESGGTLEIVRRKGRKNTLLAPATAGRDETPLDEAVLAKWLAGMDEHAFELTCGLDHVKLREGGVALKTGKGELGETLFSAATGLTSLHELLAKLREEADTLFLAHGKKPPLNAALRSYAEAKKRAVELATPPEKWIETQHEIEQARSEHEALGAQRTALAQRWARLGALASLDRERVAAEQRLHEAERASGEVRAQLAECVPAPELLAHEEVITLLQERLGGYRKARLDQPVLEGKLATLRDAAARAALGVRAGATLDDIRAMRLDRPSEARVRKLAAEGDGLRARMQQNADRAAAAEAALERARSRLEELEGGRGAAGLRDALAAAQREGDVTARATAERARAGASRHAAEARLAALGLGGTTIEAALELRVPSPEVVAFHARAARDLAERRRETSHQQQRLTDECIEGERDLAALEAEGEVPSEEALARARRERDALWVELRAAKAPPTAEGAARFEATVATADELADRLRRDASRVSQRAHIEARTRAARRKLEASAERRAQLDADAAEAGRAWEAAWAESGVTPRSPEEMGAWLTSFEAAATAARQAIDLDTSAAALEAAVSSACGSLREALEREHETPPPGAPLAQLEQMAARIASAREAAAERRAAEEGALRAAEAERLAVAKLRDAQRVAWADWEAAWTSATARLSGARPLTTDAALETLDALGAVLRALDEAEDLGRRLAGIERDARGFEQEVRDTCEACAADLIDRPAPDACAELARRAARAAQDRARREALDQQARRLEAQERAERSALEDFRGRITSAGTELGADARSAADESAALATRLEELDDRIQRASRRLGSVEAGAARWTESPAVEEAAEAQRRLTAARELAERWARARLGAAAVARLLERYRRENQGPVLARAATLFARLTLGSFRGLEVGFGEADEPVLVAVRPDERKLETSALSEGTLDQLYLALRIASLERLAATRGPMPLLLDDVLVHFDDERAAAALSALAELAQRTQVILFTHHARIVELARGAAKGAAVHELGAPVEIRPAVAP